MGYIGLRWFFMWNALCLILCWQIGLYSIRCTFPILQPSHSHAIKWMIDLLQILLTTSIFSPSCLFTNHMWLDQGNNQPNDASQIPSPHFKAAPQDWWEYFILTLALLTLALIAFRPSHFAHTHVFFPLLSLKLLSVLVLFTLHHICGGLKAFKCKACGCLSSVDSGCYGSLTEGKSRKSAVRCYCGVYTAGCPNWLTKQKGQHVSPSWWQILPPVQMSD